MVRGLPGACTYHWRSGTIRAPTQGRLARRFWDAAKVGRRHCPWTLWQRWFAPLIHCEEATLEHLWWAAGVSSRPALSSVGSCRSVPPGLATATTPRATIRRRACLQRSGPVPSLGTLAAAAELLDLPGLLGHPGGDPLQFPREPLKPTYRAIRAHLTTLGWIHWPCGDASRCPAARHEWTSWKACPALSQQAASQVSSLFLPFPLLLRNCCPISARSSTA